MSIKDVTYLSVYLNKLSQKKKSDIDSIVTLCNSEFSNLDFHSKRIFTCDVPDNRPKNIEFFKVNEISYEEFTNFVALKYADMFDSEFMINFHCDAFIINPNSWKDSFLNYDYIGAPFDAGGLRDPCSGNGGFSLRSKKFCIEFRDLFMNLPQDYKTLPEDFLCCHILREDLKLKGIKFAPFEVASQFATEHLAYKDKDFYESFGMHEFRPISESEVDNRNLNVDKKYICQNPERVEFIRNTKHNNIFNEN